MAKRKKRQGRTALLDAPPSSPPVRPGIVGLGRIVPPKIARPPYAVTGDPGPSVSSTTRTPDEIDRMRRAGVAAAEILLVAAESVRPGITSDAIDAVVHDETIRRGGYPSPLNYRGFPKSVCTSINEVICHGIPDSRLLVEGDIINVDVTIFVDGVHGDTSATFLVGEVDDLSRHLVAETRVSMYRGIDAVRPGAAVNAIGRAIENHANQHGLGVVREFIGHGVGTEFHSGIQIPHYYEPGARTLMTEAMSFTIEPMLTLGSPDLFVWDDDWTAVTRDGRRSAQFEHTLVVTPDGSEVLTLTPNGECAADRFA